MCGMRPIVRRNHTRMTEPERIAHGDDERRPHNENQRAFAPRPCRSKTAVEALNLQFERTDLIDDQYGKFGRLHDVGETFIHSSECRRPKTEPTDRKRRLTIAGRFERFDVACPDFLEHATAKANGLSIPAMSVRPCAQRSSRVVFPERIGP
jgi:hypothetical protein